MSFLRELRRRNVFRVGAAYAVAAWILLQVLDVVGEILELPAWGGKLILVLLLVGFFLALVLAWAYELTPEGVKRESEVDRSQSVTRQTGKKLNVVIIGLLLVVIGMLIAERMFFSGGFGSGPGTEEAAAEVPKSIAVLPFADLSQAQDQGWFADGLAEEILNALVKVPDLQVTSRTASFAFKGTNRPLSEIASELGVAHVLEGSVRSGGDRIRVTAQLIRASDGFHLWSQNYDRDVADMIGIQEDLARSIATALETKMDPAALAEMARVGTQSVEAYQEYLRGLQLRAEANTYSVGQRLVLTQQAYEHFEKARTLDPDFSEAHLAAANYWKVELTPNRMETGLSGAQPEDMLREYNERISRAIDTARSEADRLHGLAERALVDLRLREARELYLQYLELRPNDLQAHYDLTTVLLTLGEQEEASELVRRLKPKAATDLNFAIQYVQLAWRAADAAEAAEVVLEATRHWPNSDQLFYQGHRTLLWAGRVDDARRLAERFEVLVPGGHPAIRARQGCAEGDRAPAERALEELQPGDNNYLFQRWFFADLLGREAEQVGFVRELLRQNTLFAVSTFVIYPQFDPRPFPELMAVLEREGARLRPPVVPPFKCPPPKQPSVAVLPFVNMSADAEQEYFSDGMTEEIINALVRVPGLKVAARTSVFAFKGRQQDVRAIGEELGVTHVVEGSVRSDGQQLRITAQLIQVDDGFHLWSETFDRPQANVFAIQEEIAAAIAGELNEQLGDEAAAPEVARISVRAYDDYLRGRALLRERGDAGLEQARALFESVTAAHPDYAPGWASLAITADVQDDNAAAEGYARRALELDSDNVDALTALGAVYRDTWRWALAEEQFDKAMALDPDSAELLEDYGEFLARTGRMSELLEVTERGFAIDPYLAPLIEVYAIGLLAAGDSARAIEVLRAATRNSERQWLNGALATALIQHGDEAALRRLIADLPIPEDLRGALQEVLDEPGDSDAVSRLESRLQESDFSASAVSFFLIERVLLQGGHTGAIVELYYRQLDDFAALQSDYWFLPGFAPMRADPGFAGLLERTGLPAYWDQAGWPAQCRRQAEAIVCE